MTVMIVDDNALVRSSIIRLLTPLVDSFFECGDGGEAVDAYPKIRPDWVLMDIKMKQMDGFQATREILSSFPDAKIIMITQYDDPQLAERARTTGVTEFVMKENLTDLESLISTKRN